MNFSMRSAAALSSSSPHVKDVELKGHSSHPLSLAQHRSPFMMSTGLEISAVPVVLSSVVLSSEKSNATPLLRCKHLLLVSALLIWYRSFLYFGMKNHLVLFI